jgi:hypothetical protein
VDFHRTAPSNLNPGLEKEPDPGIGSGSFPLANQRLLNWLTRYPSYLDRTNVRGLKSCFDRFPISNYDDGESARIDVLLGDPSHVCLSNAFYPLHIIVVVIQRQAVESYWYECRRNLLRRLEIPGKLKLQIPFCARKFLGRNCLANAVQLFHEFE